MLTIDLVETPKDLTAFITAPRLIYAGMPGYFPPLDMDRRIMYSPKKSPFFIKGQVAYFLARDGGRVLGRIAAHIDGLAEGAFYANAGSFGCLDAVDDAAIVAALIAAAEGWLRQRGVTTVRGPFSLSINSESGHLIAGFSEPPMVMMPWHPPYLEAHILACGYGRAKLLHSYVMDVGNVDINALIAAKGLDRRRMALTTRGLDMKNFSKDTEIGRNLFNDAWAQNWGFVPLSPPEMQALGDNFKPLMHEDYAVVVEQGGEPVGFALCVPNIAEVMMDVGAKPSPLGWLKLGWRLLRRSYTSGRIVMFGIAGRFRNGASGAMIAAAIIEKLLRVAQKHGIRTIEAGWVLEDNIALNRMLEVFGFRRVRSYAIFEKTI